MASSNHELKQQYAQRYSGIAAQLYRFALVLVGDLARAEAVVTAAFVKGYPVLARIPEEQDFLISFFREIYRRCRNVPESGNYQAVAASSISDPQLALALAEEPVEIRACVVLTACFGCSLACTAAVLELPEDQMKSRYKAALKVLLASADGMAHVS